MTATAKTEPMTKVAPTLGGMIEEALAKLLGAIEEVKETAERASESADAAKDAAEEAKEAAEGAQSAAEEAKEAGSLAASPAPGQFYP